MRRLPARLSIYLTVIFAFVSHSVLCAPSCAQVVFYDNYGGFPSVVGAGGAAYIDPAQGDTVNLTLDATSLKSCDGVYYQVTFSYRDPASGYETDYNGGSSWVVGGSTADIQVPQEGGTAVITYYLQSNPTTQTLLFTISGVNYNPSNLIPALQANAAPVYFENILNHESLFYQFKAPSFPLHALGLNGQPLVVGNPDGIGISQIDGEVGPVRDSDYWSTQINVADGVDILYQKRSSATSAWSSLLNKWEADGAYPNNPPPTTAYPYCTFTYPAPAPIPNSTTYGYIDGIAIQDYNTASVSFVTFVGSASGTKTGHFVVGSSYVQSVCSVPGV